MYIYKYIFIIIIIIQFIYLFNSNLFIFYYYFIINFLFNNNFYFLKKIYIILQSIHLQKYTDLYINIIAFNIYLKLIGLFFLCFYVTSFILKIKEKIY